MKKLYIQFQDGSHFWGTYNRGGLYDRDEDVKSRPSYKCGDTRDLLSEEFISLNRISKVEKLEI